jgi:hypothetical protein
MYAYVLMLLGLSTNLSLHASAQKRTELPDKVSLKVSLDSNRSRFEPESRSSSLLSDRVALLSLYFLLYCSHVRALGGLPRSP